MHMLIPMLVLTRGLAALDGVRARAAWDTTVAVSDVDGSLWVYVVLARNIVEKITTVNARTHTRTQTHTHTQAQVHTHKRARTHTHVGTHTCT
jgi:hypothetical protein